jgi:hypothetical protein
MFRICIYFELSNAQIASFHCTFFLIHTLKMMVNMVVTSLPMAKCLALQHILFFQLFSCFFFPPHFHFLLLSWSMFIFLCFLFLYYSLKKFNRAFHIHAYMNFRTSKTHTTSNNKLKKLLTNIPFIFVLWLPTYPIHFLACPPSFN